jgi:hypothetical protein
MTLRKVYMFVAVLLVVVSSYFVIQFWNVVSYYNFSKDTILATRLVNIELVDTSPSALRSGFFTSSFTFENPTDQTVNLTTLTAEYRQTTSSTLSIVGVMNESKTLGPGATSVLLMFKIFPNTAALPEPHFWNVKHSIKFGAAYYSFKSSTYTSVIITSGPFSVGPGQTQAFSEATTYLLLAIDTCVIGLEAIAILILLEERKISRAQRLPGEIAHRHMLVTMLGLQGLGILLFWPFFSFLTSVVVYQPPVEFPYGLHGGAAPIAAFFLMLQFFVVGLIFLVTAAGFLLRKRSARDIALFLASVTALVSLWLGSSYLNNPFARQNLAFITLLLAATVANGITLYILLRPPTSTRENRNRTGNLRLEGQY